jgi:hypothetical protein
VAVEEDLALIVLVPAVEVAVAAEASALIKTLSEEQETHLQLLLHKETAAVLEEMALTR